MIIIWYGFVVIWKVYNYQVYKCKNYKSAWKLPFSSLIYTLLLKYEEDFQVFNKVLNIGLIFKLVRIRICWIFLICQFISTPYLQPIFHIQFFEMLISFIPSTLIYLRPAMGMHRSLMFDIDVDMHTCRRTWHSLPLQMNNCWKLKIQSCIPAQF